MPQRGCWLVALTDPRVAFNTLDVTPGQNMPYWISLPEVHAGPDLVMPHLIISFKSTVTLPAIPAAESRKAIKTTSPSLFYTKGGGELYTKGAWKTKHDKVVQLSKMWKPKIVRVRVELPSSAPSLRPPSAVSVDYWDSSTRMLNLRDGRTPWCIWTGQMCLVSLVTGSGKCTHLVTQRSSESK